MIPKISIIIPIYNVEKYLKECLDSVLSQTLQDIEIVCVNDGSTDGSKDILDEYSKEVISFWVSFNSCFWRCLVVVFM